MEENLNLNYVDYNNYIEDLSKLKLYSKDILYIDLSGILLFHPDVNNNIRMKYFNNSSYDVVFKSYLKGYCKNYNKTDLKGLNIVFRYDVEQLIIGSIIKDIESTAKEIVCQHLEVLELHTSFNSSRIVENNLGQVDLDLLEDCYIKYGVYIKNVIDNILKSYNIDYVSKDMSELITNKTERHAVLQEVNYVEATIPYMILNIIRKVNNEV